MMKNRRSPKDILETWDFLSQSIAKHKKKVLWQELHKVLKKYLTSTLDYTNSVLDPTINNDDKKKISKGELKYYSDSIKINALTDCILSILQYQLFIQTRDLEKQSHNFNIKGSRTFFSYIINYLERIGLKNGVNIFIRPSTKTKKTHPLYLNPECISELLNWPSVEPRAPRFGPALGDRHGEKG